MKPLLAGQATLRKGPHGLTLTVYDERGNIPMGAAEFAGHGLLHQIEMRDGVTVPVIELVLRIVTANGERMYRAFVNELEQGVMSSLATAPEITVVLATPKGESIGRSPLANPFKDTANESLAVIATLVDKPWNGAHFALARSYVLNKDN